MAVPAVRGPDRRREGFPKPLIDAGMGIERLAVPDCQTERRRTPGRLPSHHVEWPWPKRAGAVDAAGTHAPEARETPLLGPKRQQGERNDRHSGTADASPVCGPGKAGPFRAMEDVSCKGAHFGCRFRPPGRSKSMENALQANARQSCELRRSTDVRFRNARSMSCGGTTENEPEDTARGVKVMLEQPRDDLSEEPCGRRMSRIRVAGDHAARHVAAAAGSVAPELAERARPPRKPRMRPKGRFCILQGDPRASNSREGPKPGSGKPSKRRNKTEIP